MNLVNNEINPTRRKRVSLLSSDAAFREEVAARLEALAIYDVRIGDTDDILHADLSQVRPSLIILDVADGEILENSDIENIRENWGKVPIIALSEDLSPARMRNLVKLNTADWLHKPVKTAELINVVAKIDTGNSSQKSRITTVISASGGAGGTTVALELANHLAMRSKEHASETCLVDLDFHNSNCGGYISLINEFDLDGVVSNPQRLDVELMDVIKLTGKNGVTIYSFERPQLAMEPRGAEFVLSLLDLVAFRFEEVVIDLPKQKTPWSDAVIAASNEIVLVFELNISSLRHAKKLYRNIREIRGNNASVTMIANKNKRKLFGNHFSKKDLQKIFKQNNIKSISLDIDLLADSLNRAMLPSEVNPRSRYIKDLNKALKELLDEKK